MTIQLPYTNVTTVEEFFVWTFTPQPKLDERLPFSEVTRLGIFACKNQIPALSNQVTDTIRKNLASTEWQLQAAVVDDIYSAAPADSPLREVIRAALGQLPRSIVKGEEWEATFKKHAELGWDFFQAGDKEWTLKDYLFGVCRFHNHQGINPQELLCDGCPYAQNDCYPRWEDDSKQDQAVQEQVKDGIVVEESPKEEIPPSEDTAPREEWGETPRAKELSTEAVVEEPEQVVLPEASVLEAENVNGFVVPAPLEADIVTDVNGHHVPDAPEETVEEVPDVPVDDAKGTELPQGLVNGVNEKIADEDAIDDMNEKAQSESMAGSVAGDRDGSTTAELNGFHLEGRTGETATGKEVTEPGTPKSPKAKKKKHKRTSVSHHI